MAPNPVNELNDKSTMIKIFEYMAFGLPVVLYDLVEGLRAMPRCTPARTIQPISLRR